MESLIVGPSEQTKQEPAFDIGEILRRKRIRDILGSIRGSSLPDPEPMPDPSAADVTSPGSVSSTPKIRIPGGTYDAGGFESHPPGAVSNLYQIPESTLKLKQTIEAAPDIANYHPGRVRDIFSRIAGVGAGLQGGLAKGDAARTESYYAPFNRQMGIYQQKVQQAKAVSDIDQSIASSKEKMRMDDATIQHLNEQSKAEAARGNAENARALSEAAQRLKQLKETELLAPDHATAHRERLEEINAQHQDNSKTPFEEWRKMHPQDEISDWLDLEAKNKPETLTEYRDFRAGYIAKHPEAKGDEIATAYSAQTQKAPQLLMTIPQEGGGGKVINARPGTILPPEAMTAQQAGSMNVATSVTRTMQEAAPKVITMVDRISPLIDVNVKNLGPLAGRWSEFWAGKVGSPNPEFTKLRTDISLLTTQLMKMHVGRGGEYMQKHFQDLLTLAGQSPENLKAALGEIRDYAQTVAKHEDATPSKSEGVSVELERGPDGKLRPKK